MRCRLPATQLQWPVPRAAPLCRLLPGVNAWTNPCARGLVVFFVRPSDDEVLSPHPVAQGPERDQVVCRQVEQSGPAAGKGVRPAEEADGSGRTEYDEQRSQEGEVATEDDVGLAPGDPVEDNPNRHPYDSQRSEEHTS